MFSTHEKLFLAEKIQELLSGMNHPDLPKHGNIHFHLHVNGIDPISFCDINNSRSIYRPKPNDLLTHFHHAKPTTSGSLPITPTEDIL